LFIFDPILRLPRPRLDVLVPQVQLDGFAQDKALFGWFHPEGEHAHVFLVHDDVIGAIQQPIVGLRPTPKPFVLGVAFHFPAPRHFSFPEAFLIAGVPDFDHGPERDDLPGHFDGAPDVEPQLLGRFAPVEPGVVRVQLAPIFHQHQRARDVDIELVVLGEHVESSAERLAGPHLAEQDVTEHFRLEAFRKQQAIELEIDHRLATFVFPFGEAFDFPLFAVDVQIQQNRPFAQLFHFHLCRQWLGQR